MSKKKKVKTKKTNHSFKLFRWLYKIIDVILITPISRLIYKLGKLINRHTGGLESILNKPKSLIVFSLLTAIIAFVLVNSRAINLVETESEILSNQPIETVYNKEKYVVEGVPESVDIILMGRKSDLYLAKQLGDHKIILDLSDYKAGEYTAKLKYNHSVASITYKLDPGNVSVKISEKESAVRTLTYDLLNRDKIDSKLNISGVTLNENEVYIKSSKEKLQSVASVKALIDLNTLELESSGSFPIDSIPMVAYDEEGNVVENIEIVPSSASATITVDSYYVDLPVKVVPSGQMSTGFALASVTSSVNSVRVYGDQETISTIPYISADIDVDGLSEDKEYKVNLTKPSGVRYMSETVATVNVKVGIESSREIEIGTPEARNVGADLVANRVGNSETITVIVKGVESIISNIKPESIRAYVDLSNYGVDNYEVPVQIEGDELLATYTPKEQKIQVKISRK